MQQSSEQKERISRTKQRKSWQEMEAMQNKRKREKERNDNKRQLVDNFC